MLWTSSWNLQDTLDATLLTSSWNLRDTCEPTPRNYARIVCQGGDTHLQLLLCMMRQTHILKKCVYIRYGLFWYQWCPAIRWTPQRVDPSISYWLWFWCCWRKRCKVLHMIQWYVKRKENGWTWGHGKILWMLVALDFFVASQYLSTSNCWVPGNKALRIWNSPQTSRCSPVK